ncbi:MULTISPECIES: sulfonate ABC transporter substrate-binding protein [Acinetobacter]|jgi:sulfonate transport system substrate-binding protein|uniref:sulfonate ABC transporter substrate-binding protein n=1 Tax=Acinetobacter TaxID=469 RepID=UPI000CFE4495|nr:MULTISPECIES: sulfonate ABC transporter substrate-binding protein [Acinetobacter]MDN5417202.1 sulfonate ABC transporter substrate-binding protein [Acinetobacter sp.]MBP2546930.1 sulfonate transport system substrate-binding protein [Acinetobacter guillouiae]MCS4300044.1 sulfonate transport system substrate-binding protein [Acinetobacter guillouiae]MCU4494081.1 sulfonate ABC transporter substrate-binding protein [Acinetobacter guillouiae]MCW2253444.1 sulfonate transport system substrate-bindi
MASLFQPSWKKITLISASLATIMMLTGCSKPQETTTLNIGFQKYGVLPIIKARGDLDKALKEKGVNVKWVEFPAGPQLLEGLNVGSVAFGESGEAPPIFAQAANSNLVYVANQPAAPLAEALIVPKDSAIQSVQDLKGKRVVLNKGSNVHYLLLKVLEANHLKLDDIQVVYLPPADARAAFEKGAVDAWVIWDPFFAAAEKQLNAKVIATGQNLVNNHQFYLADRKFAEQHPDVLKIVVNELNTTTQWVSQHQTDAAKLLEKPTGLPLDILNTSISRMGFGVTPISNDVVKKQQAVADAFYQQKLIPNKINIQAAVLAN